MSLLHVGAFLLLTTLSIMAMLHALRTLSEKLALMYSAMLIIWT